MDTVREVGVLTSLGAWARGSINLRLIALGLLCLVLMIPSGMVGALITEREARREQAIAEVGGTWGGRQALTGPILHVPYRVFWKDEKGHSLSRLETAYILPTTLDIGGSVATEVRRRGIYEVVLYKAALQVSGQFTIRPIEDRTVDPAHVLWSEAFITMGVTDPRGLEKQASLRWGGETQAFRPGMSGSTLTRCGIHGRVPVPVQTAGSQGAVIPFSYELDVRGHDELLFAPTAGRTTVRLRSPWCHPSFTGAFLPQDRRSDARGFEGTWSILDLNTGLPQQWTGSAVTLDGFNFGVKMLYPVDSYQRSDRAHKYAFLVIVMTFLSLFFIEILKGERVNVLNYVLIGLATCLFYVLLLSISEHLSFDAAYAIATVATTSLVTWHARNILVHQSLCRSVGALLLGLYGFMYFLLQLQDFALLAGSVGLFVILAAVMAAASRVSFGPRMKEMSN